jgi:uncharacterized protein (TIGR04552 family)
MASKENTHIQTSLLDVGLLPYGLQDLEQVRLVLDGASIVDWRQLSMVDLNQVDDFLVRLGLRMDDPLDVKRLNSLYESAVSYIVTHSGLELDDAVGRIRDVRELFLLASRPGPSRPQACMTLKVMHIIHHAAGRELLYRLPVPISELFYRIEAQMFDALDGMKASGIRIAELAASRKAEHSIITKLLCRRDSQAAQIHDRLRFRVVTETVDDIFAVLVYLCRHVIPFNYVVPGESRNELIDFDATLDGDPRLAPLRRMLQRIGPPEDEKNRVNQFTATTYRDVNFVVDMGVRVDEWVHAMPGFQPELGGQVVFLLVEFQLVSRSAHEANNEGESRHSLYKARQRERAFRRLLCEDD